MRKEHMRKTITTIIATLATSVIFGACGTTPYPHENPSTTPELCASKAGCETLSPEQTLSRITAAFPQSTDLEAGYIPVDFSILKAPKNDPHVFDRLKDPHSVQICQGHTLQLDKNIHAARRMYIRPFDNAPKVSLKNQYIVTALVYPTPEQATQDFTRIQSWPCPDNLTLPSGHIHLTWKQTNDNYGPWTRVHAIRTMTDPSAGKWERITIGTYDYLIRGNTIIAVQYMQSGSDNNPNPVISESARLLSTFVNRIR